MGRCSDAEGAVIAAVRPDSIAAAIGLEPGDRLLTLNGLRPRDLLDYKWILATTGVRLRVVRPSGEDIVYDIEKPEEEELGLTFTSPVFDGVMTCTNRCVFCFLDQLPPGLRTGLYLRDDDYRLSILQGNFVTLTNLTEGDILRILEYRLSPLYVSVHSTDPLVRGAMLGSDRRKPVLPLLARLGEGGVRVHAQIVICPGLNDGPVLQRTVEDLAGLGEVVSSIGLVPVGLTRYRSGLSAVEPAQAKTVLQHVETWQRVFRRERGISLVHAADELYLIAGKPLPPAGRYDDFAQLENGIGLARRFLVESGEVLAGLPEKIAPVRRVLAVTGRLAVPVLAPLVRRLNLVQGVCFDLVPVPNRLLGDTVTVAGLLAGKDIVAELGERTRGDWDQVLVPSVALGGDPPAFIDGMTPAALERELGLPVRAGGTGPRDLAASVLGGDRPG